MCSHVCVTEKGLGRGGCVGPTLTKVTGAHLLHEAVGAVLHLTLGADLGHWREKQGWGRGRLAWGPESKEPLGV